VSKQKAEGGGVTRLSFIKAGAGVAAGAAAVAIPAAAQAHQEGVVTTPSSENPAEPVMAYVRDAKRGEVTVMSGTRETTYRDPALARRLIKAAPKDGGN
jgi:hypothetical protein